MLGTSIAHYEITAKLGQGGMGEVYRATDTKLDREVAIKVLPQAVAQDKERLARFEREAKVLAQLNHPNIASVYGFDQHEGVWFLVMECVEAEDLSSILKKGPIPVDEALEIGKQITEALEAAHEKDIIHRDLKPGNIKVDADGRVKVLDFGLAKALSEESNLISVSTDEDSPTITDAFTKPGTILGTAAYMSPEQARGKPVDKRSDIWAFGCVLYECLTGKKAFQGEDVTETLASIIKGECDWSLVPETTPPIVQILLRKCLIKDRKRRLQHIDDAKVDLEQANDDSTTSFIRVSNEALGGGSAKHGVRLPLVAGLVLIAVTLTLVGTWFLKPGAPSDSSILSNPANISIRTDINPGGDLPLPKNSSIAISPDGQWFAYQVGTMANGGNSRLRLRNLQTGVDKEVAPGPDAYDPFFSPDNTRLGYCTPKALQYVMIPDGNPIEICNGLNWPGGVDWPEDQRIIFSDDFGRALKEVSLSGGGEPKTIFEPDGTYAIRRPRLIPNSNLVLCTKLSGGRSEIIALNTQKGDTRIVVPDGMFPTYLLSGHLLYLRNGRLYVSRFDTEKVSLTGEPALIEQAVASQLQYSFATYAISDHGVLAFREGEFRRGSGEWGFVWMDMTGKISPAFGARGDFGRFCLSPDGGKIAAILRNVDDTSSIGIMHLDADTFDILHDSLGAQEIGVWAPDGNHIYFTRWIDEKCGIYKAQLYSTGKAELIYLGDERMLALDSITPDGKHFILVQVSQTSGRDIMKLSTSGDGMIEKLFGEEGNDGMPMVSPGGDLLAYGSNVSGQPRIYMTPLAGEFKRIPVSSGPGYWPYWHPKKKLIYYQNESGIMEVEYEITQNQFERKSEGILLKEAEGLQLAQFAMDPEGERFLVKQISISESKSNSDHLTLITGLHSLLEEKLGSDSN
jgi:serine/threonine protein kinase